MFNANIIHLEADSHLIEKTSDIIISLIKRILVGEIFSHCGRIFLKIGLKCIERLPMDRSYCPFSMVMNNKGTPKGPLVIFELGR